MSTTKSKSKRPTTGPKRPEKKYGPFHGGVGVAVWLNQVPGDDGPKFFRVVTINARRYRDKQTGEWMDGGSLRATDIPALILGLEAALGFISSTPLPGDPVDEDLFDELTAGEDAIPM